MSKINTLAELHALKEVAKAQMEGYEQQILICGGTGCTSSGSIDLYKELVRQINEKGLADKVAVIKTGCFGLCALGPIMITQPDGCFYSKLKMENIEKIIDQHIIGGNPIRELLYEETVQGEGILKYTETPFYSAQERVVLRNCGVIAPDNIEHYIARDGYTLIGYNTKADGTGDYVTLGGRVNAQGKGAVELW